VAKGCPVYRNISSRTRSFAYLHVTHFPSVTPCLKQHPSEKRTISRYISRQQAISRRAFGRGNGDAIQPAVSRPDRASSYFALPSNESLLRSVSYNSLNYVSQWILRNVNLYSRSLAATRGRREKNSSPNWPAFSMRKLSILTDGPSCAVFIFETNPLCKADSSARGTRYSQRSRGIS